MAKQNSYDFDLAFSKAQAFTVATTVGAAGAASTNQIDLGSTGMGEGVAIKGVVNVTGLTGTLTLTIASSTATAPVYTNNPVTLTVVSANGQMHFTLPQDVRRYVKLFYAVTSAATVTSWLTAETR